METSEILRKFSANNASIFFSHSPSPHSLSSLAPSLSFQINGLTSFVRLFAQHSFWLTLCSSFAIRCYYLTALCGISSCVRPWHEPVEFSIARVHMQSQPRFRCWFWSPLFWCKISEETAFIVVFHFSIYSFRRLFVLLIFCVCVFVPFKHLFVSCDAQISFYPLWLWCVCVHYQSISIIFYHHRLPHSARFMSLSFWFVSLLNTVHHFNFAIVFADAVSAHLCTYTQIKT